MNKKEWLGQGLVVIVALFFYWRGVVDANYLVRVAICLVAYNLGRLALRIIKASDTIRETLMAVLLAGLVIWTIGPSWTVVRRVAILTGICLLINKMRRS